MSTIRKKGSTENSQLKMQAKMAYPTIKQGWGIIGIFILVTIGYAIPLGMFSLMNLDTQNGPWHVVNYAIPMLLLIAITRTFWKKNPKNEGMMEFRKFPIAILPVAFIMTIGILIINSEISSWIPMPDFLIELFKKFVQPNIWGFITVVIAAPVLEEIVIRGVVLEGLLRNYSPVKAILWSAVLFAVMHLNPWQFVTALIAGLAIGYLYWRTKSLLFCIIIHAINNGMAFYLSVTNPDVLSYAEYFELRLVERIVLLFAGIVIVWMSYLFFENYFQSKIRRKS